LIAPKMESMSFRCKSIESLHIALPKVPGTPKHVGSDLHKKTICLRTCCLVWANTRLQWIGLQKQTEQIHISWERCKNGCYGIWKAYFLISSRIA